MSMLGARVAIAAKVLAVTSALAALLAGDEVERQA
jgi:hypothetical protein